MARPLIALFLSFVFALSFISCAKNKAEEPRSSSESGFNSLSIEDELSQLPQAIEEDELNIEVLPIETSPVTQSLDMSIIEAESASPAETQDILASIETLNYQQRIQTALKSAGFYEGKIDGKLGPMSTNAIKEFQAKNNLVVDGKVGPRTWAQLEPYLMAPPVAATEA